MALDELQSKVSLVFLTFPECTVHWFHQSGCCVAHFRQDWRKTRLTVLPLASVLTLTARYSQRSLHTESSSLWTLLEITLMVWISLLVWSLWITHMGVYIWNNYRSLESVCNVATDRTHGRLPRAVQCCRWWPTVQCTAHTVHLYSDIGRNVTGTQACRLLRPYAATRKSRYCLQ